MSVHRMQLAVASSAGSGAYATCTARTGDDHAPDHSRCPAIPAPRRRGIIIRGYDPVITGNLCRTEFTATEPGGTVYHNSVEFDAVPEQGGILCTNGRWRSKDGSATGTTPFRVFFKDGVRRRSP